MVQHVDFGCSMNENLHVNCCQFQRMIIKKQHVYVSGFLFRWLSSWTGPGPTFPSFKIQWQGEDPEQLVKKKLQWIARPSFNSRNGLLHTMYTFKWFEFKIFQHLDWLPLKTRELSQPCYLTHHWGYKRKIHCLSQGH